MNLSQFPPVEQISGTLRNNTVATFATGRRRFVAVLLVVSGFACLCGVACDEGKVWTSPLPEAQGVRLVLALLGVAAIAGLQRVDGHSRAPAGMFLLGWIISGLVVLVAGPPDADKYDSFFTTSAQVLAGLLVAIVVEGKSRTDADESSDAYQRQRVAVVLLGAFSALVALMPSLPGVVYAVALAAVLASGLASLTALWLLSVEIAGAKLAAAGDIDQRTGGVAGVVAE